MLEGCKAVLGRELFLEGAVGVDCPDGGREPLLEGDVATVWSPGGIFSVAEIFRDDMFVFIEWARPDLRLVCDVWYMNGQEGFVAVRADFGGEDGEFG